MTKDYILSNISEKDIFEKFLNISVILNKKIKSPFRNNDSIPSCNFYYGKDNKLRFTDFSGFTSKDRFMSWDCFDLVEYILNCQGGIPILIGNKITYLPVNITSTNTILIGNKKISIRKISFTYVLDKIAEEFRLGKYYYYNNNIKIKHSIKTTIDKIKKRDIILKCKIRNWNKFDVIYWKKYNIDLYDSNHTKMLKYFNIFPIQIAYLNNTGNYKQIYNYQNNNDVGYVYHITTIKNKNILQFYFPNRKRGKIKFITNSNRNIIFGLNQLLPSKIGIITKSYKDLMLISNFKIENKNISCIALPSENILINKKSWYKIRDYCDYWFTLFDYDIAGIRAALIYKKNYNITPILFSNSKKLSINEIRSLLIMSNRENINIKEILQYNKKFLSEFKGKDFSDNLLEITNEKMQLVINKIWKTLKEESILLTTI